MMRSYLVVTWGNASDDIQTECRRYAGLTGEACIHCDGVSYWYKQPRGLNFKVWAQQNIARMATFGVKARIEKW